MSRRVVCLTGSDLGLLLNLVNRRVATAEHALQRVDSGQRRQARLNRLRRVLELQSKLQALWGAAKSSVGPPP